MATTITRNYSVLALAAAIMTAPLAAFAAPGTPADGGALMQRMHQRAAASGQWHQDGQWGQRMFRNLDLTQDQQDQIFKIRHDQAQSLYDQGKAVRDARRALRDLTRADQFDEGATKQAADALGQAQARMALLRAETAAKIRAVLTPDQRQKLDEVQARVERKGHRGGMRSGGMHSGDMRS